MSRIPSSLNEEQDSFPIENPGEWRGNRHMAAVAEGLHGLQHWPGIWESSGRGTLFPLQKRLLQCQKPHKWGLDILSPHTQCSIHSSGRNELLSLKHKTKIGFPTRKAQCMSKSMSLHCDNKPWSIKRHRDFILLMDCRNISLPTWNAKQDFASTHTHTFIKTAMLCYLNSTENWPNAIGKVRMCQFMVKSFLYRALLQPYRIWL